MEDIKVELNNNPQKVEDWAEQESYSEKKTFRKALWITVGFFVIALILFFWKQLDALSLYNKIDNDEFGTFGDFVGGVLGTFVAFYSAYLLVRTFQDQIKTNANVVKMNESSIATNRDTIASNRKVIEQTQLQIFDGRFNTLFGLYLKAIDSYVSNDIHGRDAFESLALSFRDMGYENHTEYKRRSLGAVSVYRVLYVTNRRELSVHFRMLYLLCKLTAEEKMKEVHRVGYVKSIRGQLSEGELLLLRYNGYTNYGEKMCQYINQFNLLKHLPLMSLLEFSYWRKMINDNQKISAIDQVYLVLKQLITQMLDIEGEYRQSLILSSRYVLPL